MLDGEIISACVSVCVSDSEDGGGGWFIKGNTVLVARLSDVGCRVITRTSLLTGDCQATKERMVPESRLVAASLLAHSLTHSLH